MATIKVCDICDKRGAHTYSFFTGNFQYGGHTSEAEYDTYDFCPNCLVSNLLRVIKTHNLEPEVCKQLKRVKKKC